MSKFRFLLTEPRLVEYGLPSAREVKPDDVIEVSDAVAIPGFVHKDRFGNVLRERAEQTFADGYRVQPDIWAEVLAPPKAIAPPKADDTKEVAAQ